MTTYKLVIQGEIEAKNFASAQKKLADVEERVKRADVHAAHTELRGEKR